jgi:molybdopterin-guanine dinucleotide biosynthesis protein A
MGRDKSLLEYFGQPQRYYLYELLRELCAGAYICCNQEQLDLIPAEYNTLPDDPAYGDIGPMNALLAAFDTFPDAGFLVLGCDYPYLRKEDLQQLIKAAETSGKTTAFYNAGSQIIEPLATVYLQDIQQSLRRQFDSGMHSLRLLLEDHNIHLVDAITPLRLKSIDTPEDYHLAFELLNTN